MEILNNLGVDLKLLVSQIFNFLLLLWILNKFLYKPVIEKIDADVNASKDRELLKQERLNFEKETKEYLKQTKEQAKMQASEIIKESENIAKKIKQRAEEETQQEKEAVRKQIKSHLTEILDEHK